ncbi:hypothetical protein BDP55DRAFT_688591 [Colletotrichum godetiae]|uniref:Uncharacterized protein n=1 Tax=Colletotrichum godetiae TaxID=1209918 RepID=A0AAJ0A635_9PEZI|nr:uncharacterized protein BDP55DRAFT_688591 [Colletotrichum godetiae]KAK1656588.1 hypothetical protein BDP55DRAFT_688591 [Colletotrichum godetiae]
MASILLPQWTVNRDVFWYLLKRKLQFHLSLLVALAMAKVEPVRSSMTQCQCYALAFALGSCPRRGRFSINYDSFETRFVCLTAFEGGVLDQGAAG